MLKRIMTLALAAAALTAGHAQAQSPCSSYTVQTGDSLRAIASRAYGNGGSFQLVYTANLDAIGSNPNNITVGTVIQIPCDNGSVNEGATATTAATTSTTSSVTLAAPVAAPTGGFSPFTRPIRFVTGGDYAPFTGEELLNGGLYTDLVKTALLRAAPDREYGVDFVNDWSSHLNVLLPNGAYDAGFPWFMPDCTNLEPLGDADRRRCTVFDHSDPFYQVVIGMYTRADSPYAEARDPEDLFGATICRPKGYFQFDLQQAGLAANATIVSPVSLAECVNGVMDGSIDVYSNDVLTAETSIADNGASGAMVELTALATIQTLHVLTPKNNPLGRSYLTLLNQGLRNMVESGEWFSIVGTHLSAQ